MTTGDEPQLGGQDRDDAPMISGRGTKIIVSARGAYQTGNLRGIIDQMSSDQLMSYRAELIQQVLGNIRADLVSSERPSIFQWLDLLESWLRTPTDEHRERLMEWQFWLDINDPLEKQLASLIIGALNHNLGLHNELAEVLRASLPNSPLHYRALSSLLDDWYLETAWAVVKGVKPPRLKCDLETVERVLHDVKRWYRKRNLGMLVHIMLPSQKEQFKQAILEQALHYVNQVPIDTWPKLLRRYVKDMPNWVTQPPELGESIMDLLRSKINTDLAWRIVHTLFEGFAQFPNRHAMDLSFTLATQKAAAYVLGLLHGDSPNSVTMKPAFAAERWQLDTAYAILTDQPIPPLGASDAR